MILRLLLRPPSPYKKKQNLFLLRFDCWSCLMVRLIIKDKNFY